MSRLVDIVILNFNTREELAGCLASLHDSRPACLARIIVVDNASTDDSVAWLGQTWPDVDVVPLPDNRGFSAGNNAGIRIATAPLILLLNSDTIVPAGALDALVGRLEALGATAIGPLLTDGDHYPEVSFGPMLSPLAEVRQRIRVGLARGRGAIGRAATARLVGRERQVDWVTGACLLVVREDAIAAGLLDERYFMYEEDVDFCAALRARGGTVWFTPLAKVVHLRGRSVRRSGAAPTLHYDRSHLAFYEKHRPRWAGALRWWLRLHGRNVR